MTKRYMTVLNEEKQLETIDLNDVNYITSDKRKIIYHIETKKYTHLSTKTEFDELLMEDGFISLDKPNLVNIKKVRYFDEKYGKVFFEDTPTSLSEFCTVARIKIPFVKNLLQRVISYHKDSTTEVKSEFNKKLHHLIKGIFE